MIQGFAQMGNWVKEKFQIGGLTARFGYKVIPVWVDDFTFSDEADELIKKFSKTGKKLPTDIAVGEYKIAQFTSGGSNNTGKREIEIAGGEILLRGCFAEKVKERKYITINTEATLKISASDLLVALAYVLLAENEIPFEMHQLSVSIGALGHFIIYNFDNFWGSTARGKFYAGINKPVSATHGIRNLKTPYHIDRVLEYISIKDFNKKLYEIAGFKPDAQVVENYFKQIRDVIISLGKKAIKVANNLALAKINSIT